MGLWLFENRKLEIKENYNSYNEISGALIVRLRSPDGFLRLAIIGHFSENYLKQG